MNVASSTTSVLVDDGNDDHHKPGEVVEVVCESGFVFYEEGNYVYECLNNGGWNNSKEAVCTKG